MISIPPRLKLANLPTKIERLERLSSDLGGPNIYLKRDDQTGTEFSGNKIRKLEFTVQEAIASGCDYLITCGGIQSNHCRATAAVAARLGLKCSIVLRGTNLAEIDGNFFLDHLFGAEIVFVTPEEYANNRDGIMNDLADAKMEQGHLPYIIPEGASNGIGAYGYFLALQEIIEQEEELDINFDAICIAVGSGGTYAGLLLAKKLLTYTPPVFGVNVAATADYFKERIETVFNESLSYISEKPHLTKDEVLIFDGYVGPGYTQSTTEQLEFIQYVAKREGVIFDNVYTGKALYGMCEEIKKGSFSKMKNILFIHTGGIFELFSQKHLFKF
jgi:D-cysteine desulfhydrase